MLGGAVSIAANVAHAQVPPKDALPGWAPEPGALVSAVFWPLLLLVAVEMFARISWPSGWRWLLLRVGGLLPVAVIAAVVSYRHLSGLLTFYGEDAVTATLGPLAVDGLMVMATGALVAGRAVRVMRAPVAPAGAPTPNLDGRSTHRARTHAGRDRTAADTGTAKRTDAALLAVLETVRRDRDGTVPVRRAAKALGTGPDRARRLLADAGLLKGPATVDTPTDGDAVAPAVDAVTPDGGVR
ncbi:DUF2637 domain-containing protein [Phytohabitans rumicis]|uniref:DUF2637 domain-containing protein n=2 Tax=Phytohabitans rumicis TaxID=1076125 RepID=A0A6V8L7U2_9ACTN|nr:DUF2637 domain-containing protein [Phytohabitans rumicis]GFJ91058.1 hypothetical protein Prum_047000 [Phytohabitans rumicis]